MREPRSSTFTSIVLLVAGAMPVLGLGASQACGSGDDGAVPASELDGSVSTDAPSTSFDANAPFDGAVVHPAIDADVTACTGTTPSTATPQTNVPAPPALTVPSGFKLETLAAVSSARQLAPLPNGDLLVATNGSKIYLVPNAEADGHSGEPVLFATLPDSPAQGITFAPSVCMIYVATSHAVFALPYTTGQTSAKVGSPIAAVRTGNIPPGSDGDVHTTSSVAFSQGKVYVGVGSSCNACTEIDPTRATIQEMDPDGKNMATRATRFRNAIAMATNPDTGLVWAGGAGQDSLGTGHPYEFFDAVTSHPGTADYGWPACEENHHAYIGGSNCANTVAPLVEMPAYSTIIGAAFYSASTSGAHAFPSQYKNGLFLSGHGSWHQVAGQYYSEPRVVFVPMTGDTPTTAVDWNDPTKQWSMFVGGYQLADGNTRIARAAGVAVGSQGSLFLSDDQNGRVYRVRPN